MEKEILDIDLELRAIEKQIKDGAIGNPEDVKKRVEELRSLKTELLKKKEFTIMEVEKKTEAIDQRKAIIEAMMEKRAITINGGGAVNFVTEMFKQVLEANPIKGVSTFYGPNASTVIPVISPLPARPAAQAEGATNVSSDSTGAYGGKTLLPKAYWSVLPVSAEALKLTAGVLEGNLPGVFADVFADAIYQGMIAGTGTNEMNGLFNVSGANEITFTTSVSFKDILKLALKVQGQGAVIVTGADVIVTLMDESDKDPLKTEYLLNGTVKGVPLLASTYAPAPSVSGDVAAVAFRPKDYGLAIASEIDIKPINKVGDTNTYFQATMFFNGDTIVPKNVYMLKQA